MKSRGARLSEIRVEIDAIDGEILKLLNKRAKFGAGKWGKSKERGAELVFKPLRERDLLDKLARENPGAAAR